MPKHYYKLEISVLKFWAILVPLFLIGMVLFAGGTFLLVDKVVMPKFTDLSNKNEVVVPSIAGLSKEDAKDSLYNLGLILSTKESIYSEDKKGTVLIQDPKKAIKVKKGRHIFVTLSKGAEVSEIPDVKGLMEGPAKSALKSQGFYSYRVREVFSKATRGRALYTNPPYKDSTSREINVLLYVSKGIKPSHVTVPNNVGDMLSVAKGKVRTSSLKLGKISYQKSESAMQIGQVVSQSLTPGSRVKIGSRINLVVSTK